MATELVAARTMVRLAAWKLDSKDPDATTYCAMAKRFATDVGFDVCNEALQLHGGYGYIREYPLERHVARQPRAPDSRRHQRNHARDHRAPRIDGRGNRGDSMISSTTQKLKVEVRGHTALVTIDNPAANTWDAESLGGLRSAGRR